MVRWGHAWQGACMAGSHECQGGVHGRGACMAGEMATAVDGTHPTGMHSCFIAVVTKFVFEIDNIDTGKPMAIN